MFDLTGKTALVTGGTSGIGLAICKAFGAAGAEVIASSENGDACRETESDLRKSGYNAHGLQCDVAERDNIEHLVETANARTGGIDILVCNAGVEGPVGPVGTSRTQDFQKLFAINLESAVWLSGLLAPDMAKRNGGSIILMSSLSGLRGNKAIGSYAMSKAALAQLARNLAVEWGSSNVRANAISPGLIRTPFAEKLIANDEFMQRRLRMTPLNRVGEPEEIAGTAVYLASKAGAFVTGQNIIVDGGTIIGDGS